MRARAVYLHRTVRLALPAVLLVVLAIAAPARAAAVRIVGEQRLGPRAVELTISTPAFASLTHVDVDLPVGYDSDPRRRWPVAYFLAGMMNTYATFNSLVHGLALTQTFPAIVVSPNGDTGFWSDWYNGGAFGPPMYETYVVDQLIPLIDAHFRTMPERAERAIAGASMGGYGAMMLAAEHPDLFADAASMSGAVDSNLPYIAAAITTGPTFQGASPDAIYGPRATQEVRWHGHNPTDLASNLRGLDLQVRSANGLLNPGIGEKPLSADTVSCAIEEGVYQASISFHNTLTGLRIPHVWRDYGPGCHTPPNFEREITDTLKVFAADFAHPAPAAATFSYKSIAPSFDIWGWHIDAAPTRALEFLELSGVGPGGLTLTGSGATTVTTPPLFRGLRRVALTNATSAAAVPDRDGRISFTADLGPPDTRQQYSPGANTRRVTRTVTFGPYAVVRVLSAAAGRRGIRFCARTLGGPVTGQARLSGTRGHAVRVDLRGSTTCHAVHWKRAPRRRSVTLLITGRDAFGHTVSAHRLVRLPERHSS